MKAIKFYFIVINVFLSFPLHGESMSELYEKQVKDMIVEEIKSYGYMDGFDFDRVDFIVNDKQYQIEIGFRNYKDIVYIPKKIAFHTLFIMNFSKDRNEVTRAYSYPAGYLPVEKIKGLYPGAKYFKTEIDKLDRSLKKFAPLLQYNGVSFSLGMGVSVLENKQVMVYESPDDQLIISIEDEQFSGTIRFQYKVETGEVTNFEYIYPMPVLI